MQHLLFVLLEHAGFLAGRHEHLQFFFRVHHPGVDPAAQAKPLDDGLAGAVQQPDEGSEDLHEDFGRSDDHERRGLRVLERDGLGHGDDRELRGDKEPVGKHQRQDPGHLPRGACERRCHQALRFEKKCASTNSSMMVWLAGSTFSNWTPMPTRRSLQATRPSTSTSFLEPGMRNRTLIFDPPSSGLVVRIAMPPWLRLSVSAAAIVLPNRYWAGM